MSARTIHICDLCGQEDVETRKFYEDRGGTVHESVAWGDGDDFKDIDVCVKCQSRIVRAGIMTLLKKEYK
jgi:hypothetical protein